MTGIYKITNLQNNKIYIGQAVDIKRRWCEHESHSFNPKHSSYNYAIHCAIRKYGIKNFSFEILEECEENQLNEREIYWISKFNSKVDGYNMTDGGDASANSWNRGVNQYSLDGKYIRSFNAIRLAARKTDIDHAAIGRCCNRKVSHAGGFLWTYEGEEVIIPSKPLLIRKVGQYDLKTKDLVAIHKNATEAARAIGKNNPSNIRNACRGEQKSAYGYFWQYLND